MAVGLTRDSAKKPIGPDDLPGHLELPAENGEFVHNFRELPQNMLLSGSIWPILEELHPDRQFAIGHDCGIYWTLTEPPERGVVCPDWFYVPGVPPDLEGHYRRSYVLWKELIAPAVIIEYASDGGAKERDATPREGKFWIYEQAVHGGYYAIFVVETGDLEVYRLEGTRYRRLTPSPEGRYLIEPLGVELGVWRGLFWNEEAPWLRWYDRSGTILRHGEERAAEQRQRAEAALLIAEEERLRAERLAEKLRELGVDPTGI